jgi:CRP-like cAMP-binding protein
MQQRQQERFSTRKPVDCFQLLRRHTIFGKIGSAHLKRLCALASRRRVAPGSSIFAKGDSANAMFGVCAGAVAIAGPSFEPGALRPDLLQAGEVFGERALFGGERRFADAVAAVDCDLMIIKRRDFHALLLADPRLALKFVEILGGQLTVASQRIEEAAHLTVPTRLARALLNIADEAGINGGKLALTQHELAQAVRSSRESVNKCLRSWMRRKLIRIERGGTRLIDRPALGAIARGREDDAKTSSQARRPRRALTM